MMLIRQPKLFSRSQMISSWRRTRRWLSPYPPGRSQIASLSLRIQVKWRGVMPSAHLPRSLGGISAALLGWWWVRAASRDLMLVVAFDDAEPLPAAFDPAAVGEFAGHRLAAGDGEHTFDAGGVGRVAIDGEQSPERSAGDRRGSAGDGRRVGGIDAGRELVEHGPVVAEQPGRASENRDEVTAGDVVSQREQFMAHAVAQHRR